MNFGILSFTDNSICEIGQYVPNRCNRENQGGFALPFECIHFVRAAVVQEEKVTKLFDWELVQKGLVAVKEVV